ncbi:MAG TPA: ATP-binding protein [Acidimicrobiales bacterium]
MFAQLNPPSRRPVRHGAAERRHWPFDQWGRFLPEHTTAVSLLDRLLHHAHVVVTDGESYRMRQARTKGATPVATS